MTGCTTSQNVPSSNNGISMNSRKKKLWLKKHKDQPGKIILIIEYLKENIQGLMSTGHQPDQID